MNTRKNDCRSSAIGIEYLKNALATNEITELERDLNRYGIKLQTHSNDPRFIMGIEDLFPQIQIFLSPDIVQTICLGIASGALWDGIKFLFNSLRKIVKNKPSVHVSNGKLDTETTPNMHVNIGKNHIVLPTDIDDEKFEYFVDKMFESINQDTITEEKYVFYNAEKQTLEYYSKHEVAMKSYKQWSNENKDN